MFCFSYFSSINSLYLNRLLSTVKCLVTHPKPSLLFRNGRLTLTCFYYSFISEKERCDGKYCPSNVLCNKNSLCKCKIGFKKKAETLITWKCVDEIDVCKLKKPNMKCDPDKSPGIAGCKDLVGSYECVCKPGYRPTTDKKDCIGNSHFYWM